MLQVLHQHVAYLALTEALFYSHDFVRDLAYAYVILLDKQRKSGHNCEQVNQDMKHWHKLLRFNDRQKTFCLQMTACTLLFFLLNSVGKRLLDHNCSLES